MDFFTRFTREKKPQNNFFSQNFSVENNYFIHTPQELFNTHIVGTNEEFSEESAKRICDQRGTGFAQISDNNTVFEDPGTFLRCQLAKPQNDANFLQCLNYSDHIYVSKRPVKAYQFSVQWNANGVKEWVNPIFRSPTYPIFQKRGRNFHYLKNSFLVDQIYQITFKQ